MMLLLLLMLGPLLLEAALAVNVQNGAELLNAIRNNSTEYITIMGPVLFTAPDTQPLLVRNSLTLVGGSYGSTLEFGAHKLQLLQGVSLTLVNLTITHHTLSGDNTQQVLPLSYGPLPSINASAASLSMHQVQLLFTTAPAALSDWWSQHATAFSIGSSGVLEAQGQNVSSPLVEASIVGCVIAHNWGQFSLSAAQGMQQH